MELYADISAYIYDIPIPHFCMRTCSELTERVALLVMHRSTPRGENKRSNHYRPLSL